MQLSLLALFDKMDGARQLRNGHGTSRCCDWLSYGLWNEQWAGILSRNVHKLTKDI